MSHGPISFNQQKIKGNDIYKDAEVQYPSLITQQVKLDTCKTFSYVVSTLKHKGNHLYVCNHRGHTGNKLLHVILNLIIFALFPVHRLACIIIACFFFALLSYSFVG